MLRYLDKKIFLLLLFFAATSVGQITSHQDKKLLFKADNAYDLGDYFAALKIYESLYHLDSTSNEMNFKLGVCYFELKKYREKSKKYFDKVSVRSFPETNYYLGVLNHLDNNFVKAISCFQEYINNKDDAKEHTNKEIEDLKEKSHFAALLESSPNKLVKIENLGNAINSEYAEYAPLIPAEENFIIFTSRRKNSVFKNTDPLGDYFEDIYISEKKDGVWQPPVMLDTSINKPYHDAATGLSADGEKLLSYHTSPDHVHGHIYESNFLNGKWSSPVLLDANVNSADFVETSACYSPDGEMIFFSSNRPGGFGGKDIYSVKKLPNKKWAKPFNLGPTINTEYNEDAPFVHPFDSVLFFSSEGHKNMGGYDVFKSKFNECEKFTTPENLGFPINTVDDDIFFVLNTDASLGYFSSKREGGFGSHDIYSAFFSENNIPLNVYSVHVTDEKNNTIKKIEIILTDMEKKEVYGEYKSNEQSGKILIISKPNKTFRFAIQAEGYEPLILNSVVLNNQAGLTFKLVHKTHE